MGESFTLSSFLALRLLMYLSTSSLDSCLTFPSLLVRVRISLLYWLLNETMRYQYLILECGIETSANKATTPLVKNQSIKKRIHAHTG